MMVLMVVSMEVYADDGVDGGDCDNDGDWYDGGEGSNVMVILVILIVWCW